MPRSCRSRTTTGAAIIVLVFLIGFIVIGIIGFFGFEVHRSNVAREELRSACEAAALAGAAALASSNNTDPTVTHDNALTAAQQAFVINSIEGTLLSDVIFTDNRSSNVEAGRAANPGPNQASLYIEFTDKAGKTANWNDSAGRVVHVVGVYGEEPAFGKYVGIGKVNVTYESKARVPSMDIVMCFDVSGSIDDQTQVTFVKRWWDGSKIRYDVANNNSGPAQGTIYECAAYEPAGSIINVLPPQYLHIGGEGLTFSPVLRSGGGDAGSPPGNYPSGIVIGDSPQLFTECVANLDGKAHFTPPFTYVDKKGVSWSFPSLGTIVEAARGNLENNGLFTASKANTSLSSLGVVPRKGYKAAYDEAAFDLAMPIGAARQAATTFFKLMNNNTDAHFGFVSFSTPMPSASLNAFVPGGPYPAIAQGYPAGGTTQTPYPGITLAPNNIDPIINKILPKVQANGATDIGDAAAMAVNDLVSNGRSGSVKTVVFFTDGHPTVGPSWLPAAQQAHDQGIAFYTVGLAQNSGIIPDECDNLNDAAGKPVNYVDPTTGNPGTYTPSSAGLAAVSGNGGKFFLVTKRDDLNFVFENIARQLVQITGQ